MSNYKPRIESNNLDLTSILSTINELPDAGSGGGTPGELGTPTVDTSTGIVTATVTKGGVLEEGVSTTLQLSTQDARTITPSTSSQTAVDVGKFTTGVITVDAMPTATQATPSITVSSAGLITASATQTAGYVAEGTESATKQLTVQAAKTVTPSASVQTAVAAGKYTTGAVKVGAIPSTYKRMVTGTINNPWVQYDTSNYRITISNLGFNPTHYLLAGKYNSEKDSEIRGLVSNLDGQCCYGYNGDSCNYNCSSQVTIANNTFIWNVDRSTWIELSSDGLYYVFWS